MRIDSRRDEPSSSYGALTVWLFVSCLVVYIALTRGHFWSTDEIAIYQQTRSLWERGDLSTESFLNTLPGPDGKYYSPYSAGQSVLSLPLYGLGKGVHRLLELAGAQSWIPLFAGDVIELKPAVRWGGDVEIFFVNLFNAAAVAAIAALFFACNLRLGAGPKWSMVSTLLLAFTSHVAGFSSGYFPHPAEALFLLWTWYFLFCDSRNPSDASRLLAGVAAAAMVVVRVQTGVALPVLTLYLLWNLWKRAGAGSFSSRLFQTLSKSSMFLGPTLVAILLTSAINYVKFGRFDPGGGYLSLAADQGGFENPVVAGLYGMLFSPGASIFVFSPLLICAPWYFRGFIRRLPAEGAVIFGCVLSYVFLYVKNVSNGQWCFGPRYLMALVPLLLLPLAGWLAELRLAGRGVVAALAGVGLFIEILHFTVNVASVYSAEQYLNYVPPYSYLYIPQASQIAAHWRALVAWDGRVDFWLLYVARHFGIYPLLWVILINAGLLWFCVGKLLRCFIAAERDYANGIRIAFRSTECRALTLTVLGWLAIAYEAVFVH
ncbi:MAG TPA: hypothetical protein VKU19_01305 [Bryobacteraceae bacterium]|nr:hypothetical protein [Bryobacteraceae bacterium]